MHQSESQVRSVQSEWQPSRSPERAGSTRRCRPLAATGEQRWSARCRGEQRIRGTELTIVALLLLLGGGIVWYYQHALETSTVATPTAPSAPAIPTDASIAVL